MFNLEWISVLKILESYNSISYFGLYHKVTKIKRDHYQVLNTHLKFVSNAGGIIVLVPNISGFSIEHYNRSLLKTAT